MLKLHMHSAAYIFVFGMKKLFLPQGKFGFSLRDFDILDKNNRRTINRRASANCTMILLFICIY